MTDFVAWQKAFAQARVAEDKTRGKDSPRKLPAETERTAEEQIKAARAILEELKIYEPALAELRTGITAASHALSRGIQTRGAISDPAAASGQD